MTSLFPTLEPTAPTPAPTAPTHAFPAYVVRHYHRAAWRWMILLDSDPKTKAWEVQLGIWSPRYHFRSRRHGRTIGYRFRQYPCHDLPSAEQLALRLERHIQRRIAGRPSSLRRSVAPSLPPDPNRSLADDV